jgi:branched-chain amino acid transport system substrate-binding protein
MLKKFLPIIFALGLLLLSGCSGEPEAGGTSKTYRIGLITALSGPMGEYGQEQKALLENRVAELNKKNDYTIELVSGDGHCESDEAVHTLRKLAGEEKVRFFVGGYCAGVTLAMAPVLEEVGAVLITPTTTNTALEGLSPNVFSLAYADSLLAEAVLRELSNYDKFATITENTENRGLLEKTLDNQISAEGKQDRLVFDQSFASGGGEMGELMDGLKKSSAEAVFLNVESKDGALAVLRALDSAGADLELLGSSALGGQEVLAEAPELINGLKIIDRPEAGGNQLADYLENLPVNAALTSGKLDSYFVASSLDALDLMAQLVSDNNGDVESVLKALNTGTFSGFLGRINFNGKTFRQSVEASIKTVKDRQTEKN